MARLVIFDLGGVIVSPEIELLDCHIADFLHIGILKLRGVTLKYKSSVTRGEMGLIDMYTRVVDELGVKVEVGVILDRHLKKFIDISANLNRGVLDIIKKIKPRYKVVALSNAEIETIPICNKIGIYEPFDSVFLSCELGMAKPESGIYQRVLGDCKCAPEEAVFIDDKLENILGAQHLGIKTIHYSHEVDLSNELRVMGVE